MKKWGRRELSLAELATILCTFIGPIITGYSIAKAIVPLIIIGTILCSIWLGIMIIVIVDVEHEFKEKGYVEL